MDGCPLPSPESPHASAEAPDRSLPPVLRPQHFLELQQQVHAECQPQGLMERIVANDIARRAYSMAAVIYSRRFSFSTIPHML